MTRSTTSFSLVIPCHNESNGIRENIMEIHNELRLMLAQGLMPDEYEVIAVDDGSTDGTLAILETLQPSIPSLRVIANEKNRGKGAAVKAGVLASRGDIIAFMDADLIAAVGELRRLLPEIGRGTTIVVASRYVPGSKILQKPPLHRRILGRGFRFLRQLILQNPEVRDTQCGCKAFTKEAALAVFRRTTVQRYCFDAEALFIAKLLGYSIKELPITIQHHSFSSVHLLLDPINMFFDLFRIRLNKLRGKYDD